MIDELKNSVNVLIVDDEPLNQMALKNILQKLSNCA